MKKLAVILLLLPAAPALAQSAAPDSSRRKEALGEQRALLQELSRQGRRRRFRSRSGRARPFRIRVPPSGAQALGRHAHLHRGPVERRRDRQPCRLFCEFAKTRPAGSMARSSGHGRASWPAGLYGGRLCPMPRCHLRPAARSLRRAQRRFRPDERLGLHAHGRHAED